MKKKGRPTLCNSESIKKVCDLIRKGSHVEDACISSGIGRGRHSEWISRRDEGSPFSDFADAVEKAEAELKDELNEAWLKHGQDLVDEQGEIKKKGDWKAIESFMRRRWRKQVSDNATYIQLDMNVTDASLETIDAMSKQIMQQLADGKISVEQSKAALDCVEIRRRMIETTESAQRMSEIERKLALVQ